ncbi:unnamed protein product [Symbiodinium sp. CCMP2456]|nr:unnamed protein product [Symbiodinium sp. CCMP2456]
MADSDDDYEARKVSLICDEEDEDLLSSATEGAESDGDYHYDGGELHAIDRLKRFWDQRRYKTSTMLLIVIFSLVKALEYLMRENYKSDLRRGVGRASVCSVQFFAQVLSLLASVAISLHQEGSWRFMRRVLWSSRILHFGLLGAMFMFSFWLQISANTRHGPKVWSNIASYSGTVLAPFLSMLYFNRVYGTMQWLCFLMITFALCTFIALRERYSECPAYSDIRCGSRQAVLWIQSNADFAGAGIAFAAISLRIFASILLERLFHTWKDYYAVLKINMDFAACGVAMLGWLLADQITDEATKFQLNSSTFWGTWAAEDYALVAVLAAWFWLSGLMVKQLSTTVWVMFGQLAATTAIFIKDPLSADEHNFGVRLGPSLMLLIIAWMASLMRRTAEVYEDERKMGVVDARKVVVGQEDWAAAASAQTNEIDSISDKLWHGVCMSSDPLSADELPSGSPWLVCGYDKEDELHHLHKEEEEEEQSSGSGMDTQMLVISLAYAATDTLKTLLNSYALSSSQINVNSMSFLSFLVGLIFASLMTWYAHGLGCSRQSDEESAVEKPEKGLLQAWNFRKILEYSGSSVLQAATMCLSNMAFAFGLSPAMSAVLGKVYTPVLAVGERLILKKRRKTIEWFAVTILTLGTFAFLYLQIYDYEEGLAKAMSNSFPLILCILGACTAAIQALVSQGIYEANRDVDFYMNKVRFDAGSAAFILVAVPLLSLTASRGKDLLWLPRAVNADCDVSQCWPKVPSLANGGSIHWPWSMEESMMTCTPEACTGSCACQTGLFAGWGLQPELYLFLGVTAARLAGKMHFRCCIDSNLLTAALMDPRSLSAMRICLYKRLQETTREPQLQYRLERLYQQMVCIEHEMVSSIARTSADDEVKHKINGMQLRMQSVIRDELNSLCGSTREPAEIARDIGCCVLQATSSHGRDINGHNDDYRLENHIDMVSDKVRVAAFRSAISRCAKGKSVLDVGTGAFCLLARMALCSGASRVDAVEVNAKAVTHAAKLLRHEVTMRNRSQNLIEGLKLDEELSTSFPDIPPLAEPDASVTSLEAETTGQLDRAPSAPCYTVLVRSPAVSSRLRLYSGSLQSLHLQGPYSLIVHELLGHIASSEGVAETLQTLRCRGLCTERCTFIPSAAGTLFAPTSKLKASSLEKVLHCFFNAETRIQTQTKYHARGFDAARLMARPRFFEFLEFSVEGLAKLENTCRSRVVFITDKEGEFDGLHFHLHVQLDELTEIDTLSSATTWSTTYVKLLEQAVWLPEGARIVCECESGSRSGMRRYSVDVSVGEPWDERPLASFCWEGAYEHRQQKMYDGSRNVTDAQTEFLLKSRASVKERENTKTWLLQAKRLCPGQIHESRSAMSRGERMKHGSVRYLGLQCKIMQGSSVIDFMRILVGIIYDKYGSLHRAKCDAFGLLLVYWVGNPLLNYLTEGTSFHVSLRDECLDIVSFIVPLAALSTDIGKIMTSEMLQKVSAFRMGLFAGLLSRVRGREVVVMFSDPGGAQEEEFQEIIELLDQRAADIRKKGALVRVVDDRDIPDHWLGKLRILFNSNVGKTQQKAYKSLRDLLSDARIESAPTRVAIGVNSWSRNYHMVALCRHGVSASTAGLSQSSVRSLGIQEIKDCKEAFAKAASMHEKLMKVTKDPVHRHHQTSLEALRDGLKPQEATPPYVQFISEER